MDARVRAPTEGGFPCIFAVMLRLPHFLAVALSPSLPPATFSPPPMVRLVDTPASRRRRAPLTLAASLASLSLIGSATGCASLGPDTTVFAAVDLSRPEMQQFAVAASTDLERDVRIDTGEEGEDEKLTPALFWTGIVLGSVGAAGGIGFGAAGYATKQKLNSGYEEGGVTIEERDAAVQRGEAFNTTAVAFTTAAVLGYALAIVTYGVDWNRCGPLVRKSKRRRCKDLGFAAR